MPWAMSWRAVVPGCSRRRTDGDCIGVSPCRCGSCGRLLTVREARATGRAQHPRGASLTFAVAAIGELVAKPAGAAGVALVPAHRDLVFGTPAQVVVGRAGEALSFRRLVRRHGALLRALAVVTGGLRPHGRLDGRGNLLVQRPGLGLALLLGLLQSMLGLL